MKLKRIEDFGNNSVFEYRTPGSKNKKKLGNNTETVVAGETIDPDTTLAAVGKNVVAIDNYNDFVGVDADDNPSAGAYDVDAPTPEDRNLFKDMDYWPKDYKKLWKRIVSGMNFFVQGEAGWAKSAIIKDMAKKAGYTVITVFMDKALPEDLDGIPVVQNVNGRTIQKKVMPVWAQYMADNPRTKFLLFFDELNQAPNDVMNAMMPIAHHDRMICGKKFKNYFCGAAGNLDSENDLFQLRRPVLARFGNKPIRWITGLSDDPKEAQDAWKRSFKHLHKKWDDKIGSAIIGEFEKLCLSYSPPLFAAPRDLEWYVFEELYNFKQSGIDDDDYDRIDLETITDSIKDITNTEEGVQSGEKNANEFTKKMQTDIEKVAKKCYAFIARKKPEGGGRSFDSFETEGESGGNSGADDFSEGTINRYMRAISIDGEVAGKDENGKPFTYPITPETIYELFPKLDKTTLELVEKEMKKKNRTGVYPSLKDAIKTGKWKASDFE